MAATTRTDKRALAAVVVGASLTFVGLLATGCAAPAKAPTAAARTTRPRAESRGLLEFAPAAGLRWLVVGSPRRISADREIGGSLAVIFAPERLAAFEHSAGFRVDRLRTGAIAGYDLGALYLAELDGPEAPTVRARFAERLVDGGIVRNRSGVYRAVGTTPSGTVRALVTIDERVLAFASGDATLARIAEAYAENRLRSPTVLRGAGLRELPPLSADTLAAFLAPGPFSGEWAGAAEGIVQSADAVSIEVTKGPPGRVRAKLTLVGDFTANDDGPAKLERAWKELSESSTGRLLGLDQAIGVEARSHLQTLTFCADLAVGPLARGLHDATSADVREILELGAPGSEASP